MAERQPHAAQPACPKLSAGRSQRRKFAGRERAGPSIPNLGEIMQSRISCSAGKLSLLNPEMIEQIVAEVAFKTGTQYAAESRVRLTTSDEGHIVSSVTGNYWMHEQDIRLKDGYLVTNCSCRVEEQPICRHSIAALLAYHEQLPAAMKAGEKVTLEKAKRPAVVLEATVVEAVAVEEPPVVVATAKHSAPPATPPRETITARKAAPAAEKPKATVNTSHSMAPAPAKDLKFSEIALFIEWLQPAVDALKHGEPMPEAPETARGEIAEWVTALIDVESRRVESESIQASLKEELGALQTELTDKTGQLERTNQQLNTARREARNLQATCDEMQSSLSHCHTIINGLRDLGRQLDQCEGQIKAMGDELSKKKSQHDLLAGSFKDISAALRPLGKAAAAITG
jgi:hypothetical protein